MPQPRRDEHIAKLEKLLECAGTVTPWTQIAQSLRRVPVEVLIALVYRVERVVADAEQLGALNGAEPR